MRDTLDDRGSVVAEQLMTLVLVVLLGLAAVQLALALHVRNTLIEAAAEGARLAARADTDLAAGASRAETLAADSLGGIDVSATAETSTIAGVDAVVVTVTAPLPVVGLWGPAQTTVRSIALEESSYG